MADDSRTDPPTRLRRLLPGPAEDVDVAEAYAVPEPTAPHVRANMVSSADGSATVHGRVGELTGSADQTVLHTLRAQCDVLLVGAGTVRAEGYGPIRLTDEEQARREQEGRAGTPRLAVLSRSLELDPDAPVFTRATARPILLTPTGADPRRRALFEPVADVVEAESPAEAIAGLHERGLRHVLSEGGPHTLAQLLAADLVDELCLAVSPTAVSGEGLRITAGPPLAAPAPLRLTQVLEHEGYLFLRYLTGAGERR
ncbi:MAG TPA: pyrimidine reductase family protein [Nocardioidaceae bacterium]|nr:pyrimidine reductase family protein [Nocardioidaceae bacterium]